MSVLNLVMEHIQSRKKKIFQQLAQNFVLYQRLFLIKLENGNQWLKAGGEEFDLGFKIKN